MNLIPSPETRAAVLQHPFVLAGVAVVALLALVAGVLIVVDSARGTSADGPKAVVEPMTATPGNRSRTATAIGVIGRTKGTTAVRFAPGSRNILGTLQRDREVQIDGRTTDAEWLRVIFPPNSELHGWVDAELLDVTGDPERLVVATAEPPIVVDLPTQDPDDITPVDDDEEVPFGTETPDPNATGTPSGDELPDLVVGTTPTLSGGKLFITVVNQGEGDATGDLVIAVFNADETALLSGATLPGFTLEAGRSIDIGTGFEITQSQTLLLVVDPNGEIEETDNANNRITVAIAVGSPTEEQPLPFVTPGEEIDPDLLP